MFSDAISSISSRWRPSSLRIAWAISGSVCSTEAVKKSLLWPVEALVTDMRFPLVARWRRDGGFVEAAGAPTLRARIYGRLQAIAYRRLSAKDWRKRPHKPATSSATGAPRGGVAQARRDPRPHRPPMAAPV